jgi:ABC-type transporter Mla subunit MlaD
VGELDVVTGELANRGDRLTEVVAAGSDTLAVTSARRRELEATLRRLPPTLESTRAALVSGRRLAEPLVPALVDLRSASEPLPAALRDARRLIPRGWRRSRASSSRSPRTPRRRCASSATFSSRSTSARRASLRPPSC